MFQIVANNGRPVAQKLGHNLLYKGGGKGGRRGGRKEEGKKKEVFLGN